jgi:hypothetical protein
VRAAADKAFGEFLDAYCRYCFSKHGSKSCGILNPRNDGLFATGQPTTSNKATYAIRRISSERDSRHTSCTKNLATLRSLVRQYVDVMSERTSIRAWSSDALLNAVSKSLIYQSPRTPAASAPPFEDSGHCTQRGLQLSCNDATNPEILLSRKDLASKNSLHGPSIRGFVASRTRCPVSHGKSKLPGQLRRISPLLLCT